MTPLMNGKTRLMPMIAAMRPIERREGDEKRDMVSEGESRAVVVGGAAVGSCEGNDGDGAAAAAFFDGVELKG